MTGFSLSVCDRAFNLGLTAAELIRRVHGATGDKQMVELALAMEAKLQDKPDPEMAERSKRLFRGKA